MNAGGLGAYDRDYVARHAPWVFAALQRYFRVTIEGTEHLPRVPFVAVGNHSGATMIPDTWVWLTYYHAHASGPPLLTLAHDAMFVAYPQAVTRMCARAGAIRADREVARDALSRGFAVQVYPGGDHDACRSFAKRNQIVFAGRKGYVELARDAGVPIVPVVSRGAHETLLVLWDGSALARALGLERRHRLKVFPISLSVPWGLWMGPLPGYIPFPARITLRVLPPVDPQAGTVDEIDRRVRHAMQTAMTEMGR